MPRWIAAALFAVVMLLAAIGSQSYFGREHLRQDQYQGCLRGTLDRYVNAKGWRIAQQARMNSYRAGGPNAMNDYRAARKYAQIATSLESRTRQTVAGRRRFCDRAFPPTSILPWKA